MKSFAELEEIRKKTFNKIILRKAGAKASVVVHLPEGSDRAVTAAFSEAIAKAELVHVTVTQTADSAVKAPAADILIPGADKVTYVDLTPEKVQKIVSEHLAGGRIVSEYTK